MLRKFCAYDKYYFSSKSYITVDYIIVFFLLIKSRFSLISNNDEDSL